MRRALLTGITGSSGSYLAELLLKKGYEVFGMQRRSSSVNQTWRIDNILKSGKHIPDQVTTYYGDLTDPYSTLKLIEKVKPDELYNVGAMAHVKVSFDMPEYTAQVTGLGCLRLLESIRVIGAERDIKFLQISSSEMFGNAPAPQNETTPFNPQSPYGVSKVFAYYTTRIYRTGYKMFASNGIFFNKESPRRSETYVFNKIVHGAVRIKLGLQKNIVMGNLEAKRDIGFAGDYVRGMWMIMQHYEPDDFVIASGKNLSIRELAETIFNQVGLNFNDYYVHNAIYERPNEVNELLGDDSKARRILGWKPEVTLEQLIDMTIESAFKEYKKRK